MNLTKYKVRIEWCSSDDGEPLQPLILEQNGWYETHSGKRHALELLTLDVAGMIKSISVMGACLPIAADDISSAFCEIIDNDSPAFYSPTKSPADAAISTLPEPRESS